MKLIFKTVFYWYHLPTKCLGSSCNGCRHFKLSPHTLSPQTFFCAKKAGITWCAWRRVPSVTWLPLVYGSVELLQCNWTLKLHRNRDSRCQHANNSRKVVLGLSSHIVIRQQFILRNNGKQWLRPCCKHFEARFTESTVTRKCMSFQLFDFRVGRALGITPIGGATI